MKFFKSDSRNKSVSGLSTYSFVENYSKPKLPVKIVLNDGLKKFVAVNKR